MNPESSHFNESRLVQLTECIMKNYPNFIYLEYSGSIFISIFHALLQNLKMSVKTHPNLVRIPLITRISV